MWKWPGNEAKTTYHCEDCLMKTATRDCRVTKIGDNSTCLVLWEEGGREEREGEREEREGERRGREGGREGRERTEGGEEGKERREEGEEGRKNGSGRKYMNLMHC